MLKFVKRDYGRSVYAAEGEQYRYVIRRSPTYADKGVRWELNIIKKGQDGMPIQGQGTWDWGATKKELIAVAESHNADNSTPAVIGKGLGFLGGAR